MVVVVVEDDGNFNPNSNFLTTTTTTFSSFTTASPPQSHHIPLPHLSSLSATTTPVRPPLDPPLPSSEVKDRAAPRAPRAHRVRRCSFESYHPTTSADVDAAETSSQAQFSCRRNSSWISPSILRPPSVRLANPINYVPRITPVTVPRFPQPSEENLPLEAHRDAYPLLTIPEQRRSRLNPSPNSLLVERSQGETESGRSSIAVPRGQRRSGAVEEYLISQEMSDLGLSNVAQDAPKPRTPERAHLGLEFMPDGPGPHPDNRPRHVRSQVSLRSQSQIASVPSNTGFPAGGEPEMAEELAWGPAHPCFPHFNPHVPINSEEFLTTRIIRIRRDWMVKGDLAPTFSNLYPEILDPLLPEQEFRRVIATVNDELIKAFDPFSLRNIIDSALGLLTGWLWEDVGAPAIKSHLKSVESWLENWNREVGAKDGVHIWSLRRTAYLSLDIQIPDPKVGIIPSESGLSLPGTRPSSGAV
ncbi:hypothetical protein BO86DRAFT_398333 [Aspergillus japonicus CBS 114.51]|nr:hypothetical protein BO86DRAFT_398333 [Aspergillus japonicus CBS 114.51]RAH83303.1 hypothetical protein BO86DRAFT_398333 [Aspergillus japonicus CBS 114.51]